VRGKKYVFFVNEDRQKRSFLDI